MSTSHHGNKRTPSTTWEWRRVKIRAPRRPQEGSDAAGVTSKLPEWYRRDPLSIEVVERGGAEAWIRIRSRGREWFVPGHLALYDVLSMVWYDHPRGAKYTGPNQRP